jgi:hypothetical protein
VLAGLAAAAMTIAAAAPAREPTGDASAVAAPGAASKPVAEPSTADVVAAAGGTPKASLAVAAVQAAASAVRADPDLGGMRKERTWRFRDDNRKREPTVPPPQWLRELALWLAEGGRGLMWLLGAAALAVLLVTARRWLSLRAAAPVARGGRLPSHVRELDIRPESLPADIGAAVRELWLAGDRRAALSLLYRGALSRLVHSYAVAIGDASTEGDCVRLARDALPAQRADFVGALVGAWQLAVYGDRPLATDHVLGLCADFDRLLPALAAAAPLDGASRR